MDVTDLRVYQNALTAFKEIEKLIKDLPHELADVRRQILRSAKCIPPLIAEGFGRKRSQKEFRRFIIEGGDVFIRRNHHSPEGNCSLRIQQNPHRAAAKNRRKI